MEKTSLQVEKDMLDDLDKIAEIRGMKRSQVMRLAQKEFIQRSREKGEIK